jgi:hypothetical protein
MIIKLAAIGAGFARLEQLGLAAKAVQKYSGSSWLKNAPAKVIPEIKKVTTEIPKVIPVNAWSKR